MTPIIIRCCLLWILIGFYPAAAALGSASDFIPQPVDVLSGPLQYANTDWRLTISRTFKFGTLPTEMSYRIMVMIDLASHGRSGGGSDTDTERVGLATISGSVNWYDHPVAKPGYRCPSYEESIAFTTTGRFAIRRESEDPSWRKFGTLTIYEFPHTPYQQPYRDYTVACEAWSESSGRWEPAPETRPAQDFLSPFLQIALQPGSYTRSGDLYPGVRTWNSKIEIVGSPLECRNLCDDLNACTRDRCKLGVGCEREPLTGSYNFSPHDCVKVECTNGYEAELPDDAETPLQESPSDCWRQICLGGTVNEIRDTTEIPPQEPHNCRREECGQYDIIYRIDNTDLPLQDSPHDCVRETCQLGEPVSVADDSEIPPPTPDGREQICRNGFPVPAP